jgi:DNA-binding FrmR family transcriptional regulator
MNHSHNHTHTQKEKKLINRMHILQGQLEGLEKMVESQGYCPDVIRLSLAIQRSLQSFNQLMLEKHLQEHVSHQFKSGQDKKAIKELLDIYFLSNK